MTRTPKSPADGDADRAARLAEQLRANLRKRKAQARGNVPAAAPEPSREPEG